MMFDDCFERPQILPLPNTRTLARHFASISTSNGTDSRFGQGDMPDSHHQNIIVPGATASGRNRRRSILLFLFLLALRFRFASTPIPLLQPRSSGLPYICIPLEEACQMIRSHNSRELQLVRAGASLGVGSANEDWKWLLSGGILFRCHCRRLVICRACHRRHAHSFSE